MDEAQIDAMSDAITFVIKNLLPNTHFNPTTERVEFEPDIIKLQEGIIEDVTNEYLIQVAPNLQAEISPDWFWSLVFANIGGRNPITNLEIHNNQGMNDDDRSHRGDELPENFVVPIMPDQDEDEDEQAERNKARFVRDLDERTYLRNWEKSSPVGISWGDVMEGVMLVKGSKFDKWYELFSNAYVSFPEHGTIHIDLSFDHGS